MTPDPHTELRAAAEKATRGEWELIGGGEYIAGPGIVVAPDDGGVSETDAAFIAAASPDVVLSLLDTAAEVAGLRAELDTARKQIVTLLDANTTLVVAYDERDNQLAEARRTLDERDALLGQIAEKLLYRTEEPQETLHELRDLFAASRPSSPDNTETSSGGTCPTPCDDDCTALCHEDHQVSWKKKHDRETCPGVLAESGSGEARRG